MIESCQFLTSRHLDGLDRVAHGFFTRNGGVSNGLYASLNVGIGSDDDPDAVSENRRRAREAIDARDLVTPYQVHSDTALIYRDSKTGADRPEGDALVTDKPGVALGVVTADCAPVLLADRDAGVVAAAHAGWRGALDGIVEATVGKMMELGARPERIHAAIGPCIQQRSYEVGDDLRMRFLSVDESYERFFGDGRANTKYQFDLAGFVATRLAGAAVRYAEIIDADTYADRDHFFSYRRSCHRKEPDFGRQLSAICLS